NCTTRRIIGHHRQNVSIGYCQVQIGHVNIFWVLGRKGWGSSTRSADLICRSPAFSIKSSRSHSAGQSTPWGKKRAEASRVAAIECGPWRQPWEEEAEQETSPGKGDRNS